MKEKHVESIGTFCELLNRSRLLAPGDVLSLEQRWFREAAQPADLRTFASWLVANQYATDFQVAMLLHGHFAHLRLGPYKLLERLGRGRLTMTYKAVHRLGGLVAIKVLAPNRARDPQVLAHFQQEARLAQRLQHPNVVRTLEAGQEDGLHYLVMEYLPGQTLQETLDQQGRLGVEAAVDIAYHALLGLQHLHEHGLVHGRIEPANLMLIPTSSPGTDSPISEASPKPLVKIIDTRSIRPVSTSADGKRQDVCGLPHEELLQGTPGYLALEQARSSDDFDIRANIYSLGCILYHALAGQAPYQDDSPLRQMIRHATESPRPLRECNEEVPEGLELMVNWMIAREPSQRYQTPERAAGALAAYLCGARCAPMMSAPDDSPPGVTTKEGNQAETNMAPEPDAAANHPTFDTPLQSFELPVSGSDHREAQHGCIREQQVLGRRECLLLAMGAGGLLVAQAIGWLAGRVSHKSGKERPKAIGSR